MLSNSLDRCESPNDEVVQVEALMVRLGKWKFWQLGWGSGTARDETRQEEVP